MINTARIDDMGSRIDDLEKALNDLMAQVRNVTKISGCLPFQDQLLYCLHC